MSSQALQRQQALLARQQLSDTQIKHYSQHIVTQLIALPAISQASVIASYLACHNEVDLSLLAQWCWEQEKTLLLPQCDVPQPGYLSWLRYTSNTPLSKNHYGILEPAPHHSELFSIAQIDVVLTPLVAFDTCRHRIGMGKGYYDRTFSNSADRPIMIGCAFSCQQVDSIHTNSWDVPLTAVITEQKVYT